MPEWSKICQYAPFHDDWDGLSLSSFIYLVRKNINMLPKVMTPSAAIAQLGERETEDLKVTGSIPVRGTFFTLFKRSVNLIKSPYK